jgi:peptide/nickel transport system substrate-binding protein
VHIDVRCVPAALLAAAGLTLVACGGTKPEGGGTAVAPAARPVDAAQLKGAAPEKVTIATRADIDSLDPAVTTNTEGDQQLLLATYSRLVYQAADGRLRPLLASRWNTRGAATTFFIRPGATCADGRPLDAEAVAANFRRMADPKSGARSASRLFGSAGVKRITVAAAAGSVTVELKAPFSGMAEFLAGAPGSIVCPAGLEDVKALSSTPQGTGPYTLGEAVRGDHYTLNRRTGGYVLPAGISPDQLPRTIVVKVSESASTTANLLLTGGVDIASVLGEDHTRLDSDTRFTRVDGPAHGVDGMLFNQRRGLPGADPAVRRALAAAVDRRAYSSAATFGLGTPSATLYTPNMSCYAAGNATAGAAFDLAQAKALLARAGYGPDHPLKLRLVGFQSQNGGPEYVQSALSKLPGVTVTLSNGTFQQAVKIVTETGDWDVFLYPYTAPESSPQLYVSQVVGDPAASLNVGNIQNRAYERAAVRASQTEGTAACADWQKGERALLAAADVLPLTQQIGPWYGRDVRFSGDFYAVDPFSIRRAGE